MVSFLLESNGADLSFDKKRIVITGAGHGLGRALSIALSRLGGYLTLVSKNQQHLDETLRQMQHHEEHKSFLADLENLDQVSILCKEIQRKFCSIDLLINNAAGFWLPGSLSTTTQTQIGNMLDVTLKAPLILVRELLPALKLANSSQVINIVSITAAETLDILVTEKESISAFYCAAKSGLHSFGEAARAELEEHGIQLTNIYPGEFCNKSALDAPQPLKKMGVVHVVRSILFAASGTQKTKIRKVTVSKKHFSTK